MRPRIGSMCTGYAGLDSAVQAVIGGEHAWMAENDPHASKVLAHHWPAVPNLGDITATDWAGVEPVGVVVAGFPCTDISDAGPKVGINGKRSGIWRNVAEAVRVLRPALVVLENVAAIRSRGLNVVAADLAAIGYDAQWTCLRASDVGAAHRRDRWFCVAYPAASDAERGGRHRRARNLTEARGWNEPAYGGDQAPGIALLPTPCVADGEGTRATRGGDRSGELLLTGIARDVSNGHGVEWGKYEPAIRRWEGITGNASPEPVEPAPKGGHRLAPAFSEWLMGIAPGHVTGVPDLSRSAQLRIIGGGVVPRQGIAAIEMLLALMAHLKEAAA